jgi:hypothetical protein
MRRAATDTQPNELRPAPFQKISVDIREFDVNAERREAEGAVG